MLLPVFVHVSVQLALHAELVPTLRTHEVLLLLMQHDVGLEACHAGELLTTLRADRFSVFAHMCGQMQAQIVLHIEGGTALHAPATRGKDSPWCSNTSWTRYTTVRWLWKGQLNTFWFSHIQQCLEMNLYLAYFSKLYIMPTALLLNKAFHLIAILKRDKEIDKGRSIEAAMEKKPQTRDKNSADETHTKCKRQRQNNKGPHQQKT